MSANPSVLEPPATEKTYHLHEAEDTSGAYVLDRRGSERYRCSRQRFVRIIARPLLSTFDAAIRDFSMEGLGLLVDKPLELGTLFAVQLRSSTSGLSGMLTGEVRRSEQVQDGRWVVGCSLSKRLTDLEALALL